MHSRLHHGFRYAHEIQLNPRIPTQTSSVGSPATNSRLSRHDLCCNRNTPTRPIKIEERPYRRTRSRAEEEIYSLDVAMNNFTGVKEYQTPKYLAKDMSYFVFTNERHFFPILLSLMMKLSSLPAAAFIQSRTCIICD